MKNKILSVVLAVLCVLSMVPFTAFADDTVTYEQHFGAEVHNFVGTKFEDPYASGGNHKIYGYNFATNTEFDGETVTAITRNPDYPDVYAHRVYNDADDYSTSFGTNLFSYNELSIGGKKVSLFDSKYVVVDYYYDRHDDGAEDLGEKAVTEIVDTNMTFDINSVYIDGAKSTAYNAGNVLSNSTIKANEWDTIVFDLEAHFRSKDLPEEYLTPAGEASAQMGQFKIYIFGNAGGINLHDDDAFYIKSIRFMSYDPTVEYGSIDIEVYSDADGTEWLYYNLLEGDTYSLLDTYTLPEFPEESLPEGCALAYYKEANTGMTYNAGDTVTLNWGKSNAAPLTSYQFKPVFSAVETINFTVDGENSFTEKWALNAQVTLPDAPVAPEGQRFAGWNDGTKAYLAGSTYDFTTAGVSFTAVFVDADTYYVSADGAIDGVSAYVYTSLDEAENVIAADDGIGTIFVEGDVSFKAMTFESSKVTVKGYNDAAKVFFCEASSIYTGNDTDLTFDDVIIRRADGSNDENWITLRDIHLTFGENCGFEQGTRTTNNNKMDLYISQYASSSVGYSFTNNSDAVRIAHLTPDGNYGSGNLTFTGDVNYVINAGTIGTASMGNRNGLKTSSPNNRTGDVYYEVNGGAITNFNLGFLPTNVDGDFTAIFNGGTVTNLYFGDGGTYGEEKAQSNITGTLTYVINAAGMDVAPSVKKNYPVTAGTSILVYNNEELAEMPVEVGVEADYIVLTTKGVATPVEGQNGKFTIVPDDASFDQVLANGVVLEADGNGYYTLEEGTSRVTFGREGFATYTFSISDNGSVEVYGAYYNGDEFKLPALTPAADLVHDAYIINGITYEPGDTFVMPEEDVVAEVVWFENNTNTWYVSKDGNNSNAGHKATKPVATIARAFELIGTNNGTIVLVDMVTGFSAVPLADGQTVRITGEGYEGAGFANGKTRLTISKGHLILDHLIDYNNDGGETNTPFILSGNANITIGEGYKLAVLKNGVMTVVSDGTQIEMPNAANPVVNADGDIQFINFIDWGNGTITGDVTINIGPNAHFIGAQGGSAVVFGGDAGTSDTNKYGHTSTVNGKIFVNVDGTQTSSKIYRNGFKAVAHSALNGFQILLKNTTMTYGGDHPNHGDYTNNGPEYIVTATTVVGTDVVTTEFGKVQITLAENTVAKITDANGTREITASEEITLAEGETLIQCLSNAKVNVSIDGGDAVQEPAGSIYTLPEGEAPEGRIFVGWIIDGVFYAEGAQYTLPSEDGATVEITSYTVAEDAHIYVDAANGDDANMPFSADKAVQSMAAATNIAEAFANPIIHVIGTYEGNIGLPTHTGVVTITGEGTDGVLAYAEGLYLNSAAVVFENIGLKATVPNKFIEAYGRNITFGEGTYAVEGTNYISIHAGNYNSNQSGDQVINIDAPIALQGVYPGPYYNSYGTTKTYTGDFTLNINAVGASVQNVRYGDSYGGATGPNGTFTHDGNFIVNVAEGARLVNADSANTNTTTTGKFVVYNYGETVTTCGYNEGDVTHVFNFVDGVEVVSYEDGILTVAEPAYDIASGTNSVDNKLELASGAYSIRAGKSLKNEGLDIEGAQIRLETEDEPQGLRFVANYTDELAAQYEGCEYGFVVIPTSVVGNNAVADGAVYGEYAAITVPAVRLYKEYDGYVQYTACMVGLEVVQYKTEYTAVPYVLVDGEYIYGEQYSTSVYKVAQAVLADETVTDENVRASMQALIAAADAPAEAE